MNKNEFMSSRCLDVSPKKKEGQSAGLFTLDKSQSHKPIRVENAIILAAGNGSGFIPLSLEFPKGLTIVKGERLIERQLRQLREAGIEKIYIVVGYKREAFDYLKEKYDVELVYNPFYRTKDILFSVLSAKDF